MGQNSGNIRTLPSQQFYNRLTAQSEGGSYITNNSNYAPIRIKLSPDITAAGPALKPVCWLFWVTSTLLWYPAAGRDGRMAAVSANVIVVQDRGGWEDVVTARQRWTQSTLTRQPARWVLHKPSLLHIRTVKANTTRWYLLMQRVQNIWLENLVSTQISLPWQVPTLIIIKFPELNWLTFASICKPLSALR